MKIKIGKTTTTIEEIDITLPIFKQTTGTVHKLYEDDGVFFRDSITHYYDDKFSYLQHFSVGWQEYDTYPDTTIEHYSAELEKFILSVQKDQEALFYVDEIKIISHSELER